MNILIIEDDNAQRILLQMALSKQGHKVKSTNAVLPAFEMIRRGNLDVVLMDIGLPGLDGISFVKKLRKYTEFDNIRFFAVTGRTDQYSRDHALAAGCVAYVEKPIDIAALLKLLSQFAPMEEPVKKINYPTNGFKSKVLSPSVVNS